MSKHDLLPRGRLFRPDMKLEEMQALPLDDKIWISKKRITEYYEHFNGKVYVSFSGGKDSTVLLHLTRSIRPDVKAVFFDTGLEFPEILDFVKTTENIEIRKPKMTFKSVIEKHGYPVISKEQSRYIREARNGTSKLIAYRMGGEGRFCISEKWKPLINAPFKISERCCDELKKKPAHKFERESGLARMIGTMAGESRLRRQKFLQHGCNSYNTKAPISKPLSPWLESDIWEYIKRFDVPYCKIYDMGYDRTGCMFCAFGAHLDTYPNRFQMMSKTHPTQYRYCMEKLGMKDVLNHICVDTTMPDNICQIIEDSYER